MMVQYLFQSAGAPKDLSALYQSACLIPLLCLVNMNIININQYILVFHLKNFFR